MTNIIRGMMLTLVLLGTGCNRLRLTDFPSQPLSAPASLLTAQGNYQRNPVSDRELAPPLVPLWKKDYVFLPNRGFTAAENIFFFGTGTGYLAAATSRDGDLVGKKHLGNACAVPPTIYGSILYQTFEAGANGLIAYDLNRGKVLWEIPSAFSPASVIAQDNKVFVLSASGRVSCYNYLTGALIWSRPVDSQAVNSPALWQNTLIVAGLHGNVTALEYTSGVVLWARTISDDAIMADPVIQGECLYLVTYKGDLQVWQLKNGNSLFTHSYKIPFYCAPVVDTSRIYLPFSSGSLLALDKQSLEVDWKFQTDGPWGDSPLVTPHFVYAANLNEKLYILDKSSGDLKQELALSGRGRSTPVIIDNKLIVTCENTTVTAYVQED